MEQSIDDVHVFVCNLAPVFWVTPPKGCSAPENHPPREMTVSHGHVGLQMAPHSGSLGDPIRIPQCERSRT
uniref:Uncharacterized protein n=1 Tax=Oryza glumipatula TaxID=40148 RepID=A0A0E0A2K0_9ORYZ